MDQKVSDLEHKLIKKEIENISFKMNEGFGTIDKMLKVHFDALRTKNDSEAEVTGMQLDAILVEQKRTNGRVTRQEQVTTVLSTMQNNKWLTALALYAIYNLLEVTTMANIIKIIKYFL